MKSLKALILCFPFAVPAGYAQAQDVNASSAQSETGRNTIYIGGGRANTDDRFENDDTPYSIGFMHQGAYSKTIIGFDIAREGTMIDSTWGQDDEVEQATSFNLLLGRNFVDNGRFTADAALLLGMRESFSDCPDSYLGYQCYADSEPDTDYKGNFGGVVSFTFDKVMVGLRVTGESAQLLAGFRF